MSLSESLSFLQPRAGGTTEDGDRAPSQGGVIEGSNPTVYNPKDPIVIFIIQASFILIICHVLHWPLSKIRQPRVIAEVIGGIILGPSVMGQIPNFRETIFPQESIPNLTLVANLGLVLYLFLIGVETDVRFLVSNWRIASAVAFAGLALPFGLGCALAWGLYNQFNDEDGVLPIEFSTYLLFIGVAIAITVSSSPAMLPVGGCHLMCLRCRHFQFCAEFSPNSTFWALRLVSSRFQQVSPTMLLVNRSPFLSIIITVKLSPWLLPSRLDSSRSLRDPGQRWQWTLFVVYPTRLSRLPSTPPVCRQACLTLAVALEGGP